MLDIKLLEQPPRYISYRHAVTPRAHIDGNLQLSTDHDVSPHANQTQSSARLVYIQSHTNGTIPAGVADDANDGSGCDPQKCRPPEHRSSELNAVAR
jgi:hypothetical protein